MKLLWTMGCGHSIIKKKGDDSTNAKAKKRKSSSTNAHKHDKTDAENTVVPINIDNNEDNGMGGGGVKVSIRQTMGLVSNDGDISQGELNVDGLPPPVTPSAPTESLVRIRKDSSVPMPTMPIQTDSQIEFFKMLDEKIASGSDYKPDTT